MERSANLPAEGGAFTRAETRFRDAGHILQPRRAGVPVEWLVSDGLVPYEDALSAMETHVAALTHAGAPDAEVKEPEAVPERVWLLEHPPLYTAGTSANPRDIVTPLGLPVHRSGRGGQMTYHGPGQRVAYLMLDLNRRGRDVRAYVAALERWLILALARLGIEGEVRADRVGVWVRREGANPREDKIAAIGVRIKRWITLHGVSLNVNPNLSHYDGIIPCGITNHGVTSLWDLGSKIAMADVDAALRQAFGEVFGETIIVVE